MARPASPRLVGRPHPGLETWTEADTATQNPRLNGVYRAKSRSAGLEEEGVPRLCKYLENARETMLLQGEIWDGDCVAQGSPSWGSEGGTLTSRFLSRFFRGALELGGAEH